jgi:putative ABC transport system permease protein
MTKHYLLLATKVLLRRKFFTVISLFGISFTLLVLMVATALLDHLFAAAAPETRQARTIGVYAARMSGAHSDMNGSPGFKLLDRYARNLPGVERLSLFTSAQRVSSYPGGRKIDLSLKRTDGEFWQILDFAFVEGGPYSSRDVEQVQFVAVINTTTRRTLFGDQPALGKTIEADGQRFRVVGVVQDVSELRFVPFADIWIPYTTAKTSAYRNELLGNFNAMALATDRSALSRIREEFNSRLLRTEFDDPDYDTMVAPFGTTFEMVARELRLFMDRTDTAPQTWKLELLLALITGLFLTLPTVNLININVSRIMERADEIGIRKAFGASSATLVGQFLVENVLLTLAGGLAGLAASSLVLRAVNQSGVSKYVQLGLNFRVFFSGLLLALLFGLISGVYPAWRMARLHPVDALKGAGTR